MMRAVLFLLCSFSLVNSAVVKLQREHGDNIHILTNVGTVGIAVYGAPQCTLFCVQNSFCAGIGYDAQLTTCQLYFQNSSLTLGTPAVRSSIFNLPRCPSPPLVSNADAAYTGLHVGQEVRYTCHRDYVNVGQDVTYCSPSLEWALPGGNCVRCNLSGPDLLPAVGEDPDIKAVVKVTWTIPLGATITIILTPTVVSRFTVNFVSGSDTIMHLDNRLSYGGFDFNTMICTHTVNGIWPDNYLTQVSNVYAVGKQYNLTIQVGLPDYKIIMDGSVVMSCPVGIHPSSIQEIQVKRDAVITSIDACP